MSDETTTTGWYPSGLRLSKAQDQTLRRWPLERIRPKSVALAVRSLIAEVDAERDEVARLRERVAELEGALERGRDFIARTIEAVTPEPCRCAPIEFCGECLAIKTLEEALTALAQADDGGRS